MSLSTIAIWVSGIPQPGGSKRAFVINGKAKITEANTKSKPWRHAVGWEASQVIKDPETGPLQVTFQFYLPRPKSHYKSGKHADELKPHAANLWPIGKPDTTKLVRSTEDSLKGIAWHDDSQIVMQYASKAYGDTPGVKIIIRRVSVLGFDDL